MDKSQLLVNTVEQYLELSGQVQQAIENLKSFYNSTTVQQVLDNVDQSQVSAQAFNVFEDSCICGNWESYVENMLVD